MWAALAWATSRPTIKGLIVSEAGDYGTITGLRAPDGHLRRATYPVMSAARSEGGEGGGAEFEGAVGGLPLKYPVLP